VVCQLSGTRNVFYRTRPGPEFSSCTQRGLKSSIWLSQVRFGPIWGRNLVSTSHVIIRTRHKTLGTSDEGELDGQCMQHAYWTLEINTNFVASET
jgi:hypothetical protein